MHDSECMRIALHALDENLKVLESSPTNPRALDDAKDSACIVEKLCAVCESGAYAKLAKEMP